MIVEHGLNNAELLEHLKQQIHLYSTDESVLDGVPTGDGLSEELDSALLDIAEAKRDGLDLQPFIVAAWDVFNELLDG